MLFFFFRLIQLSVLIFVGEEKERVWFDNTLHTWKPRTKGTTWSMVTKLEFFYERSKSNGKWMLLLFKLLFLLAASQPTLLEMKNKITTAQTIQSATSNFLSVHSHWARVMHRLDKIAFFLSKYTSTPVKLLSGPPRVHKKSYKASVQQLASVHKIDCIQKLLDRKHLNQLLKQYFCLDLRLNKCELHDPLHKHNTTSACCRNRMDIRTHWMSHASFSSLILSCML